MSQIITFGEVLMRLSPEGNKKFIQANEKSSLNLKFLKYRYIFQPY